MIHALRPPRTLRSASTLRAHWDRVLSSLAFPPDAAQRIAARSELARFGSRVRRLSARERSRLADSGIPGTRTRGEFAVSLLREIEAAAPGSLTIDWAEFPEAEQLDLLLAELLVSPEGEAFHAGQVSTEEWVDRARGSRNEIAWLLDQVPRTAAGRHRWERTLDSLPIPVHWRIPDAGPEPAQGWSGCPAAFRTQLRRSRPRSARAIIAQPLEQITLLDPTVARRAIATAQLALAVRGREVHAMSFPNPDEVYLADLGHGIGLLVIGALHRERMSLEANYGYVLLSNGIPIGYGGVTPLFHQANTGLNVFPSFRGGEASAIFCHTLRAFRVLFGVERFVVNPVQFGQDNEEALASGAFWFYYRLGFRPVDPGIRRLARDEASRLAQDRSRRSPRSLLVRLATCDLDLALAGARVARRFDETWVHDLSLRVTGLLGGRPERTRTDAIRAVVRQVATWLGAPPHRRSRWLMGEQAAFRDLAPIAALIRPGARWSPSRRAALLGWIRAKGALQERGFVQQSQALDWLRERLAAAAQGR